MTRRQMTIRSRPPSARSAMARCCRISRRNTANGPVGATGRTNFPEWEPCAQHPVQERILGIENVGGDLDAVTGRRCTFAFFPWNWDRGDGCIIRLVAITDPKQQYRIEAGERF